MDEKIKILVVDDEPGMRIGAKRIFELEGYNVTAADCGQQGIDLGLARRVRRDIARFANARR